MDSETLGLSSLGESKSDTMSKEEALGIVGRYRELVNKRCDGALKELNAFPSDTLPWSYVIFLLMSCSYYGAAPEGGSND